MNAVAFPIYTLNVRRDGKAGSGAHNLAQLWRLAKLLRKQRIDIVHSHDNFPSTYARVAALLARIPLVYITYHNIYSWLTPSHHRMNRLLARITTKFVAVSVSVKDWSVLEAGMPAAKFEVIPNGIPCPTYRNREALRRRYRQEFAIADHQIVIGNVATLSERKGQSVLVEALHQLTELSLDAVVLIVGSEREDEPDIRRQIDRLAARLGVEGRIVFAGSRSDVLNIYPAFDVFAMPSLTEGFGLALAEALCARVPCVVSDIPVFREVTREGRYAKLSKVGDGKDLAEKINQVITHPEESLQLTHRARNFVAENYSRDAMIQSYEKLYHEGLRGIGVR